MTLLPPPPGLLAGAALFLDFDGTLVEIAATPAAVTVPATLAPLLTRLADALGGRVAIVSGRAVADIRRLLPLPLAIAGSHGQELALPGQPALAPDRTPALDRAQAAVHAFVADRPGALVEEKPLGIGLHYRAAPALEAEATAFAAALAAEHGLHLQRGKMVAELRLPGGGKGEALERLMREPLFASARPLFMGDDLTDEPAFAAASAHHGAGILIGPPRDTHARYRLDGVADALAWLSSAAQGLAA